MICSRIFKRSSDSRKRGFTLFETMIGLSIFSVVGYGLFIAVDIGYDSSDIVTEVTGNNRKLRSAVRSLNDELGQSADANITVTETIGGNHEVNFTVPITVAGVDTWGAYDRALGTHEDDWSKADWQIRYTVEEVLVDGETRLDLVRQIVNIAGEVQRSTTIAENLVQGQGVDLARGFTVEQTGDVWSVTCTTYGSETSDTTASTVFHIRTRN